MLCLYSSWPGYSAKNEQNICLVLIIIYHSHAHVTLQFFFIIKVYFNLHALSSHISLNF